MRRDKRVLGSILLALAANIYYVDSGERVGFTRDYTIALPRMAVWCVV